MIKNKDSGKIRKHLITINLFFGGIMSANDTCSKYT